MTKLYTFINDDKWNDGIPKSCFHCKKKGFVPAAHVEANDAAVLRGQEIVYTCLKCLWKD